MPPPPVITSCDIPPPQDASDSGSAGRHRGRRTAGEGGLGPPLNVSGSRPPSHKDSPGWIRPIIPPGICSAMMMTTPHGGFCSNTPDQHPRPSRRFPRGRPCGGAPPSSSSVRGKSAGSASDAIVRKDLDRRCQGISPRPGSSGGHSERRRLRCCCTQPLRHSPLAGPGETLATAQQQEEGLVLVSSSDLQSQPIVQRCSRPADPARSR